MSTYDRILEICKFVFPILLIFGLLWLFYENKAATHYVEVHFKDGNVKRFDKNAHIELHKVKEHVYYILRPSGTTIPFEVVEYAEIKENEKGH